MRARRLVVAAALVALLAGCTATSGRVDTTEPARAGAAVDRTAASLPRSSTQKAPAHLAKGLLPPTNRWFSGLAIPKRPQPVFPTPLAFTPTDRGFAIGLPTVTDTADTIFGSAVPAFGLGLGTTSMQVVRYDDLTVTARFGSAADVTLAQGWPYVALRARKALTARLTSPVAAAGSTEVWTAEVGGVAYAVRAPEGAVDGDTLRLAEGERAVLFALPAGVDRDAMIAGSRGVVTSGAATATAGARTTRTRLAYRTTGGPTLLAALPYQQAGGAGCGVGTVRNIAGDLHLCSGTSLTFGVPTRLASAALPVASLSTARKARIRTALRADIAATPAQPADSYGAGKWLYRVANLLQLARQTGDGRSAAAARSLLGEALTTWTEKRGCATRDTHCFVYDPRMKGIVGRAASYGSDAFNDHHFHYGYLLYAAAVAVTDRPALAKRIEPVVDAVAADIASPAATRSFPRQRVFDAYAGHSWASGNGDFADGNDEESSSEAVSAWNGVALWAKATGDRRMLRHATWLLSTEIATAKAGWLYPDLSAFPRYDHAFVTLQWGGKRDSATWFSADPAAKLGIQLIPMSPVSTYTRGPAARMAANLQEARRARTGLFADYLLLYDRLGGRSRAASLAALQRIPTARLDTAMSRSYATAFLLTR